MKNTSGAPRVVTAVVAAFNPDADFLKRVAELQAQVNEVIVVNDGSSESHADTFEAVAALGSLVVHQAQNSGIAAALNAGVRRALERVSPDFILTMDQDSCLDVEYVRKAITTYEAARMARIKVGLVSAESFNGVPALRDGTAGMRFGVPFDPWQSGMLIPSKVFESDIFLNEAYFIDNVDSEFALNLRLKGYIPILGEGCNLLHNLGEKRTGRLFGREIAYTYHSPKRVYYITRNSCFLARDYGAKRPVWFLRKTFHDILNQVIRLVLSEDKRSVAGMITAGIKDGLRGRAGRFEDRYTQEK